MDWKARGLEEKHTVHESSLPISLPILSDHGLLYVYAWMKSYTRLSLSQRFKIYFFRIKSAIERTCKG